MGMVATGLTLVAGRWLFARRAPRPTPRSQAGEASRPDPFEHGSSTEQRRALRRSGNPVEVLVSDAEVTAEPVPGWVLDRSVGGVCLALSDEVAAGTVLSLRPRQAPPGTPWVRAEVRTCKKAQDQFEVGCQFVRTPPWSILLLFG
jgi:hypothetical protein